MATLCLQFDFYYYIRIRLKIQAQNLCNLFLLVRGIGRQGNQIVSDPQMIRWEGSVEKSLLRIQEKY